MEKAMEDILRLCRTEGRPVCCVPHGSGHINRTWLAETDRSRRYILQQVNTAAFPDPDGLMRNIILVTEHIRKKDPVPGHVLTLIPTVEGGYYIKRSGNELWRMYEFISGGICLDRAESPEDLRVSGTAFGGITALLSMLNSCAAGVSVVNIDNGFGAGFLASRINHIGTGERNQ